MSAATLSGGNAAAPGVTMAPLTREAIPTAARMVAVTFAGGPTYAYILRAPPMAGQRADPVEVLAWLFERNFALPGRLEACRVGVGADGKVACFYMIEPPELMEPMSLGTLVWAGLWQVPLRFGLEPTRRLLSVVDWYDAKMVEVAKRALDGRDPVPCCKLERMVVAPQLQGKGVGTRCLQQGLDEASSRGHAVVLATQEERNVRFYSRLGFEVVFTEDFPTVDGEEDIPNWFMVRWPDR